MKLLTRCKDCCLELAMHQVCSVEQKLIGFLLSNKDYLMVFMYS
ncbi:hypothetical protein FACS1894188_11790 [Clostridia bacterium]|nr:hypothetical protein FACS1894188_11790 [Clostridia bacterium]